MSFILTISSCSRDSCKNVSCPEVANPNTGTSIPQQCVQGKCVCEDGYEGLYCDTLSANKYTGNYLVYENCLGTPCNFCSYNVYMSPYTANINGFTYPNAISINGLFNLGIVAYAFIYTDYTNHGNNIQVPNQSSNGVTFYGSGSYNPLTKDITITFTYTLGGGNGGTYQCVHTFYPQ